MKDCDFSSGQCPACGFCAAAHVRRNCPASKGLKFPGTELKRLIKELGLSEPPGCQCNARAKKMDRWGVTGCRENHAKIIGWLKEAFTKVNWSDTIAAYRKLRKAEWFSHFDPFGSILSEAIRRAEQSTPAKTSNSAVGSGTTVSDTAST